MTSAEQFCGEDYRNYLTTLARIQLASAGPLRRKLDSADLVQDVLLQAHIAAAQFRGTTPEAYGAWLRQILAHKLADAQRHFGRKKRDAALEATYRETLDGSANRLFLLPIAQQTSASLHIARQQWGLRLADVLQQLPEDQRIAVELHYVGEYSLDEIASQLERSKPSVAGLLRRGLKALREELGSISRP
jgi:RNA polymerase sigma-70 factor (ECF subfamily)